MEIRCFFELTYCPAEKEYVTYDEGCRACPHNDYYSSLDNAVYCTYGDKEGEE